MNQSSNDKIVVQNLSKRFEVNGDPLLALNDINLNIADGELLCVLGPSGCGKTTLLRILSGLEENFDGNVTIVPNATTMPLFSVVFQEYSIFPWLTVQENIAYGLKMRGVSQNEIDSRVEHFITRVNLQGFEGYYPTQLSGGMKQRVSVARAFANNPEILFMDEPFANLDALTRLLLQQELVQIWQETHKTIVFITHSINEALLIADRVVIMSARPGTIIVEFKVSLPRPRQIDQIGNMMEYSQIWAVLKAEIQGK